MNLYEEHCILVLTYAFLYAATLAATMSDDLLARATVNVVQILKNKDVKPDMTRTNIQMIGAFWCGRRPCIPPVQIYWVD